MKWIAFAAGVCLGSTAFAGSPVPRPAKELTVIQPAGKPILLSGYRGKVVLVQFLYTTCSHCQDAARMYGKLQTELGSRGFEVVGVAFNPEAQERPELVNSFVISNSIGFPVGVSSRQTVLSYLGASATDRVVVPQIVIIDRKGTVRAQSEFAGSPELQDESYVRSFLKRLLQEKSVNSAGTRLR
jgi:peroxiredoxin